MFTTIGGRKLPCISTFLLRTLAGAGLLLCTMAGAQAQSEVLIIKVEEDWELDVALPDPEANVPQVVCVFGPEDPASGLHAVFEINHLTSPSFSPGGMQLQAWRGEQQLWHVTHPNNREFDAAVDRIKFTTVTELISGRLYLDIDNGQSVNWGDFGRHGYLRGSLPTTRVHLNDYNPDYSVAHSRIAYGKHRVNRFVRTEVRYYSVLGLSRTETDDAVVFSQDPVE